MDERLLVIIDDEEDLLDLFEYNFNREGFQVKTFTRALPALDFILQHRPDMILCDWMMPEMDGLELCRRVKSDVSLAGIPFVMVTCRSEREAVRRALSEGVTDYIPKPIRLSDLIGKVRLLLNQQPRSLPGAD